MHISTRNWLKHRAHSDILDLLINRCVYYITEPMMTYTDGVHLVADYVEELHRFAKKIGLKRVWFQDHEKHPHYDILSQKILRKALSHGAIHVSKKDIVQVSIQHRRRFGVQQKSG